jgi:protein gp37
MNPLNRRLFIEENGIDIDMFLSESDFQRELIARCRSADLDGATVSLVSPEDLVLLKLIAGCTKISTGTRPIRQTWVTDIRDQCVAAGVPFFFKQSGGVFKKRSGRVLDRRTWDQLPV